MLTEWQCDPNELVSVADLKALERSLDRVWRALGVDVVFTRHFMDRVNDPRNGTQITLCEIERLFREEFEKHGKEIVAAVSKRSELSGILKQFSTDLNLPFRLKRNGDSIELVMTTIMRTHRFFATGPQKIFKVERKMGPFESLVEAQHPRLRLENTPWGRGKVRAVLQEDVSPAIPTTRLAGELQVSDSGWCLLKVPNEIVQGLFASLDEPGISLPTSDRYNKGKLNAHISVMDGDEVKGIGVDNVRQHDGRKMRYQIGPLKVVTPVDSTTWKKVWYVTAFSPELEEFRTGFGLTPKPHNNEFDYHLTVAVLRSE